MIVPTRGELDTANPIGDRPVGTLVTARDMSARYWGPRVGSKAFTRLWEGPGTKSLYNYITLNGTNSARGFGRSYEDQFRDLGTSFTLDVWFILEDWSFAAALDEVGLYEFTAGGYGDISVGIYGGTQGANEKKIKVGITTCTARNAAAATVTLTGTNTISSGTTATYRHHLRVVREGATATAYIDGISDATSSSLSATNPIYGPLLSLGDVTLGTSATSDGSFKGKILAAILRDGAFSSAPIENVMPCNPWAPNVHHYILGRSIDLGGGEPHFYDAGRFAVHPRLIFNAGSDYSVTASNYDNSPAPAYIQGLDTWTSRQNRTVTTVVGGGQVMTAVVS